MKTTVLSSLLAEFDLSRSQMRRIKLAVKSELEAGLAGRKSSMPMLPAFCDAANGHEKGRFLALDLGGTNFRILLVKLAGAGTPPQVLAEAKYALTPAQISGTGDQLFNAIAAYLKRFLQEHQLTDPIPLGYTFSFPVELLSLAEGRLIKWTKDFTATGVKGRKIVKLLQQALTRQGIPQVQIVALANDTVGTLQAQATLDPACSMGVILGTGFNIAARFPARLITKRPGLPRRSAMVINMEAGNFNKALPRNRFDRRLDKDSENEGHQWAEKMISGKYLPQLVRHLVLELQEKGLLFKHESIPVFSHKDRFKGWHMDLIGIAPRQKLDAHSPELFGRLLTPAERRLLANLCQRVAQRSAQVAAALIAGTLTRVAQRTPRHVTIAVDGSLFEKYPSYDRLLARALKTLNRRSIRVQLKLTKDGSGIGAAVMAALAIRS